MLEKRYSPNILDLAALALLVLLALIIVVSLALSACIREGA